MSLVHHHIRRESHEEKSTASDTGRRCRQQVYSSTLSLKRVWSLLLLLLPLQQCILSAITAHTRLMASYYCCCSLALISALYPVECLPVFLRQYLDRFHYYFFHRHRSPSKISAKCDDIFVTYQTDENDGVQRKEEVGQFPLL